MKTILFGFCLVTFVCVSMAQSVHITRGGYPASINKELLEQFIQRGIETMRADGDSGLFRLLDDKRLGVFLLKDSLEVSILERTKDGYVKFKHKNIPIGVWTLEVAVKPKR